MPDKKQHKQNAIAHAVTDVSGIAAMVLLVIFGGLDSTIAAVVIAVIVGAWGAQALRGDTGAGPSTGMLLGFGHGIVEAIKRSKGV